VKAWAALVLTAGGIVLTGPPPRLRRTALRIGIFLRLIYKLKTSRISWPPLHGTPSPDRSNRSDRYVGALLALSSPHKSSRLPKRSSSRSVVPLASPLAAPETEAEAAAAAAAAGRRPTAAIPGPPMTSPGPPVTAAPPVATAKPAGGAAGVGAASGVGSPARAPTFPAPGPTLSKSPSCPANHEGRTPCPRRSACSQRARFQPASG
jgi:hypothetical protein